MIYKATAGDFPFRVGQTGLTLTMYVAKGASAPVAAEGAIAETDTGWYTWAHTENDTNANILGLSARTASGVEVWWTVVATGQDYTAARAGALDNLDETVGSRLPTQGYTPPNNTGIGTAATAATAAQDRVEKALPDAKPGEAGGLPTVDAANMVAGVQGDTKQTGDAYLRIGEAGAGLTALASAEGLAEVGEALADLAEVASDERLAQLGAGETALPAQAAAIRERTDNLPDDPARDATVAALAEAAAAWAMETAGIGQEVKPERMAQLDAEGLPRAVADVPAEVLGVAVPAEPVPGSVGETLRFARAYVAGKWLLANDVLTLYDADGETVVRRFALAPATGPKRSATPIG